VGALATLSRNFLMGFLRPVVGNPDVELVLRSGPAGDLLRALETLNLDIILVTRPADRDALTPFVSHRLAEQAVSLVGTPDLCPPGADLAQMLAQRQVILPTSDSGVRVGFDALADRLSIRPQIAAEVDDMAMMRLLAREGVGLAVLPPIVVQDELRSGTLIEVDRLPGISETFYAVTMDRRFPNPLIRDLLGAIDAAPLDPGPR
jgi:LysR family transcriptional activator of nhaA